MEPKYIVSVCDIDEQTEENFFSINSLLKHLSLQICLIQYVYIFLIFIIISYNYLLFSFNIFA